MFLKLVTKMVGISTPNFCKFLILLSKHWCYALTSVNVFLKLVTKMVGISTPLCLTRSSNGDSNGSFGRSGRLGRSLLHTCSRPGIPFKAGDTGRPLGTERGVVPASSLEACNCSKSQTVPADLCRWSKESPNCSSRKQVKGVSTSWTKDSFKKNPFHDHAGNRLLQS